MRVILEHITFLHQSRFAGKRNFPPEIWRSDRSRRDGAENAVKIIHKNHLFRFRPLKMGFWHFSENKKEK